MISIATTAVSTPARRAWYAVAILVVLYCVSITDRLVMSLLASQISASLKVSDTQLGLLFGMGFGVVYAVSGLPLAQMIDNRHRVRMITVGVLVWSSCTVASGFAPNYASLMILRAGVAIGEAILSPAAISIIADLFPREKRTLPTAVYSGTGAFMAAGAFVLGGAALQVATWLSPRVGLQPWQLTLVFVGLPGLILAPLFFATVREPARAREPQAADLATGRQAIAFVIREGRLYLLLGLGLAAYSIGSYAKVAWAATLMVRSHGYTPSQAGYIYGALGLASGISGAILWPVLADRWNRRRSKDAMITMFAIAILLSSICLIVVGATHTTWVFCLAVAGTTFFGCASTVLPPLIVQYVAPARLRARLMAGSFMCVNLIGLVVGPPLAAFISEHFFTGPFALGGGIAVVGCIVTPIAGLSILLTRPRYRQAMDEAAAREADAAVTSLPS